MVAECMHSTLLPSSPALRRAAQKGGCFAGSRKYPILRIPFSREGSANLVPRGLLDGVLGVARRNKEQEGPNFAPIDPDEDGGLGGTSEELFGPLAVLLIGFAQPEVDRFKEMMMDMEADMVKILVCTKESMSLTLEEALNARAQPYEQLDHTQLYTGHQYPSLALGTKRAVILSGMSGAEVQEIISAYSDSGCPNTVWAAAVPGNYQSRVSDLLQEIYEDHELMQYRKE